MLCAMHDCALGISPVTSYSGVKEDLLGVGGAFVGYLGTATTVTVLQ